MKALHLLQLIALSALWGSSFMLTRVAAPVLGPGMLAALRMGLAALVLGSIMRALGQRWPLEHVRQLALLGFVGVGAPHWLQAFGALHMPAGYAALLYVVSVLFGGLAAVWLKLEVLTPPKIVGCLLGIAGCALIVRLGSVQATPTFAWAVLAMLLSAAMSGASTPMLKRSVQSLEPLAVTAMMHATAFVMLLPGAVVDWPAARFTAPALAAVALMGIATSGIAWWLYARLLRHIAPMAGLSSTFLITGFGVLWAVLFLDETVDSGMYVGGALVLLASALVSGLLRWPRRGTTPAASSTPAGTSR